MFNGRWFTFESGKRQPIHRWFYYKEAFSPECVEYFIDLFELGRDNIILDPFVGIGTTPLVSKSKNITSIGFDISPLAVLVTKVKTRNYDSVFIDRVKKTLDELLKEKNDDGVYEWRYELFPPERAFPKRNIRFIASMRKKIMYIDDEYIRDFFMVALASILPQTSLIIKDGGVLKINKRKKAAPAKKMFIKKINGMMRDLELMKDIMKNKEPHISLGNAKNLPIDDESVDAIITSPPYLNNIDYTKVYGLELSLIGSDPSTVRRRALKSFITKTPKKVDNEIVDDIISNFSKEIYKVPIALEYLNETIGVINEMYRVLKYNGKVSYIVGDAIIGGVFIPITRIVAYIGENIGFRTNIIDGLERKTRINGILYHSNESAIIMEKTP